MQWVFQLVVLDWLRFNFLNFVGAANHRPKPESKTMKNFNKYIGLAINDSSDPSIPVECYAQSLEEAISILERASVCETSEN